ncbi:isochorismatase family protein [Bradyrhizobium pachyrhizi]|uniref:isochorismatase family protein n=1 Tax=Bradyrhizobium TaxID=374 RepID=UPI0024B20A2A|nr:isochorismatase family protein [Bradyrhizobium pachyrhizi]WFU58454.1 isochorismatase family protein [Bradyrhizobium pachyrhizi]
MCDVFVTMAGDPGSLFDLARGNGRLHSFLNERQVDTLIVAGGETDVFALATALATVDRGYRVMLEWLCSCSDESRAALLNL